jgi:microcystin-dependent protein
MEFTFDRADYKVDGTVDSVVAWKNKYNSFLDKMGDIVDDTDITFVKPVLAPTAPVGTSTTQLATTEFVTTADKLKAPLDSPALTGIPTAPTALAGTNNNQLATTAFVTSADNLKAPLDSPALTGIPTAPTAPVGTSTTQLATTAFVTSAGTAGLVSFFAMSAAPTGWLKANGATISRTTYARLFAAIGTTFGAGDGSTTFSLPDLRGEFLRGFDDGRTLDNGRVFGSVQGGSVQAHTHTSYALVDLNGGDGIYDATGVSNVVYAHDFDTRAITSSSYGGTETRPRNVALLACIKY